MELIKKEDQKLFCSYELGTIEFTNETEKVTYEVRLSTKYEPMIIFPDGDIAIITWTDIIEFARYTKNNRYKEAKENERIQDK